MFELTPGEYCPTDDLLSGGIVGFIIIYVY